MHLDPGRTFKLDTFSFELYSDGDEYPDGDEFPVYPDGFEPLLKFLNSQSSLTHLELSTNCVDSIKVEATCLPNLTWVSAPFPWLRSLISDRPVSEVNIVEHSVKHEDLKFFTLSGAPIQKLTAANCCLYPIPVKHLASVFPSLVHLCMYMHMTTYEEVRVFIFFIFLVIGY
jgi:hypothetical protein